MGCTSARVHEAGEAALFQALSGGKPAKAGFRAWSSNQSTPSGVFKQGNMINTEITFHNKTEIKALAQIFAGSALISSCMANPGETCTIPTGSNKYDIFLKNGATGWELARKLGSEAKSLTLIKEQMGWYVITES